jgi:nucleoid DNA-binding protein
MALVGKDQLVHEVAERSGLEVEDARRALDEMLTAIEVQLGKGNEVRLTGFGKFSVSRRKAREGRNPQTGDSIQIPAKKVPHFSAGAELKKAVPPPPRSGSAKSRSKRGTEVAADPGEEGSEREVEASGPADSAVDESRPGSSEDGATSQSQSKRSRGPRRALKTSRRPTARKSRGASGDDEAEASDSTGGDEEESGRSSATDLLAGSRAKSALVTAAGLAVGVAGGLAVTHRR